MKRLALGVVALAVAAGLADGVTAASSGHAKRECGLPSSHPLWIDFGHGSTVPFWRLFARPGLVSATANFLWPPQIRARGGSAVYMDLNFHRDMGGPGSPVDYSLVSDLANGEYEYASAALRCTHPWIALNELFGAGTATPWPPSVATYRANVLDYLRVLARRGAHPLLLVNSVPNTEGAAGDWWREVAKVADLVREDYFPAPRIYRQGPYEGSRTLRRAFRRAVSDFTSIGIPASRLGLMLGFQTGRGKGGREGLKPARKWFATVKWQALAVRQVARETGLSSIWSWGWARRDGHRDELDKARAACVWLWARHRRLCKGPKAAGRGFDASLEEGRIDFHAGIRCKVRGTPVRGDAVRALARVTGDEDSAFAALYQRAVTRPLVRVRLRDVRAAERWVVRARFHGSRRAYHSALFKARATVEVARGVLRDELTRLALERRMRAAKPSRSRIRSFYADYADIAARPVRVKTAAPWLGGRSGIALQGFAPDRVFKLRKGRWGPVRTAVATYRVRPLGPAVPLAATPLKRARPAIGAALKQISLQNAYNGRVTRLALDGFRFTACRRDEMPSPEAVNPASFLPFLGLTL